MYFALLHEYLSLNPYVIKLITLTVLKKKTYMSFFTNFNLFFNKQNIIVIFLIIN